MDFVKQRRRWFLGLVRCVFETPVRARFRLALGVSTFAWSISWIGLLTTLVNLFAGERVPPVAQAIGDFVLATYLVAYVVGLKVNLDNLDQSVAISPLKVGCLYLLQTVLLPIFSAMEAAGILYGMLRPTKGFHVVRKSYGHSVPAKTQASSRSRPLIVAIPAIPINQPHAMSVFSASSAALSAIEPAPGTTWAAGA
jgi:hypothetical protein